jgi:hypothetical protein
MQKVRNLDHATTLSAKAKIGYISTSTTPLRVHPVLYQDLDDIALIVIIIIIIIMSF